MYLRPLDSLNSNYYFISEHTDDCQHYPQPREKKLIQSIHGSYKDGGLDRILWLDEFNDLITNFKQQHDQLIIRNHTYEHVMEYDVVQGKRLTRLYYNRTYGFVGYQLKDGTVFALDNI